LFNFLIISCFLPTTPDHVLTVLVGLFHFSACPCKKILNALQPLLNIYCLLLPNADALYILTLGDCAEAYACALMFSQLSSLLSVNVPYSPTYFSRGPIKIPVDACVAFVSLQSY
jgi:hypothetical protein